MRIKTSKKTKVISARDFLWFIILICYLESPYLSRFQFMDILYTVGKLFSVGFILLHIKKIRFNLVMVVIILLETALWISTLRAGTPLGSVSKQVISVTAFIFIIDIMLKEDAKRCIRVLYIIMELLIYTNVVSMLLFPNGLYHPLAVAGTKKYYFLGHQNAMGLYSTIAIVLGEFRLQVDEDENYKFRRLIFLEAVSIFYVIRVWSVTSLLSVTCIIIINFYNRISKKGWRVSLALSLVLNVLIFILVVLMQNLYFFSSFLQTVLRREVTLSGRTRLWSRAFSVFLQEPVWGVGQGQGNEIFGFATTHNRYMNTLFTGGIVGIVLFAILLILICKKLNNTKENVTRILISYFTVLLIIIQGETFDDILFYLMFVVACNIQCLRRTKKEK